MRLASPSCFMTTATLELATANRVAKSTLGFRLGATATPLTMFRLCPSSTSRESLSGAIVLARVRSLSLALANDRVKAIVSQTCACGPTMPPQDPDGTLFAAVKTTFDNGNVSIPDAVTGPLPVVSFDQHGTPSLLTPISAYRWFIEYGGRHGTRWENWVTRVIPKTPAPYHPGICAPYVKAPTLMMIAPEDEMAGANPAVARAAYDSIPAKKELVEIAGGHFGLLHYPSSIRPFAPSATFSFESSSNPWATNTLHRTAPRPLREVGWHATGLHDPAQSTGRARSR